MERIVTNVKIPVMNVVPRESAAMTNLTAVINSEILTNVYWKMAVVLESVPTALRHKAAGLGFGRRRLQMTVVPRDSFARMTMTAVINSEILSTVNWTATTVVVVLEIAPTPLGDNGAGLGIRCQSIPAFPRLVLLVGPV